ncbi:MAG: alpha/beta fold hydrolase, partial [bacterium]|nr:alpha/beta fold hydrolase [bacterium]
PAEPPPPEPPPEPTSDPYAPPPAEEPEPEAPEPEEPTEEPASTEQAGYDAPGALEVPQPLPPGEPGEIIDIEELDLGEDYVGYRVLYHSRSLRGDDIAVSGFVATPAGEPPPGGWPLVAYAHGTTGTADVCAPSHDAEGEIVSNGSYLGGYAVAATDYEGLGTPGLHPYIVGRSEARGVLDSVRAAHNLGSMLGADGMPRVSVSDDFVVWGHSQGGHAAIHTGQHWQEYAPELQLLGVASGAPPSQFALLYSVLLGGPFQGYLAMASAAFAEAYDEVELDQVYTEEAIALMDVLETGCKQDVFDVFNPLSAEQMLKVASPLGVSPWDRVIVENDTNQAPVPVPLLILHGSDDEQIPALSSQILLGQLCVLDGQGPTDRILYEGHDHGSVIAAQRDDLLGWIADRFAGEAAPNTCA